MDLIVQGRTWQISFLYMAIWLHGDTYSGNYETIFSLSAVSMYIKPVEAWATDNHKPHPKLVYSNKVWDEITYLKLKFGVNVEVWKIDFILRFTGMWLLIHAGIKSNPF